MINIRNIITKYLNKNSYQNDKTILNKINEMKIILKSHPKLYKDAEHEYTIIINKINIPLIKSIIEQKVYIEDEIEDEIQDENDDNTNSVQNILLKKLIEQKKIHNFVKFEILKKYCGMIDEKKKLSEIKPSEIKPSIVSSEKKTSPKTKMFNLKIKKLNLEITKKKKIIKEKNVLIEQLEEEKIELKKKIEIAEKVYAQKKIEDDEQKCKDEEIYRDFEKKIKLLEEELSTINIEVRNLIINIEEMDKLLNKKDQEIIGKIREIDDKDKKIGEIEILIHKIEEDIIEKEKLMSNIEEKLSQRDELIREKDELIREKDNELKEKDELIREKENELKEKDSEICRNFEMREIQSKRLRQLENKLSEKKKKILKINSLLKEKEIEKKKFLEKIKNRNRLINTLELKIHKWKGINSSNLEKIEKERQNNQTLKIELSVEKENIKSLQKLIKQLEHNRNLEQKQETSIKDELLQQINKYEDDIRKYDMLLSEHGEINSKEISRLQELNSNIMRDLVSFHEQLKNLEIKNEEKECEIIRLSNEICLKDIDLDEQKCFIQEILSDSQKKINEFEKVRKKLEKINTTNRFYSINSLLSDVRIINDLWSNPEENPSPDTDTITSLYHNLTTKFNQPDYIPEKIKNKATKFGYNIGNTLWSIWTVMPRLSKQETFLLRCSENKLYSSFFFYNGIEVVFYNDDDDEPVYNFLSESFSSYDAAFNALQKYFKRENEPDFPNIKEYDFVRLNIEMINLTGENLLIDIAAAEYGYQKGSEKYGIFDVKPIVNTDYCGFILKNKIQVRFYKDYTVKYVIRNSEEIDNYEDIYNRNFSMLYKSFSLLSKGLNILGNILLSPITNISNVVGAIGSIVGFGPEISDEDSDED
jgi:hypothetical protein